MRASGKNMFPSPRKRSIIDKKTQSGQRMALNVQKNRNIESLPPLGFINLQRALNVLLILGLSALFVGVAIGQELSEAEPIPAPNEEEFRKADGLIEAFESRNTACLMNKKLNCRFIRTSPEDGRDVLTFYDSNGKLWFSYDRVHGNKKDLLPPEIDPITWSGLGLYRLVGESANWYKVEINDKTRETKFILRSDENWVKIDWAERFFRNPPIYLPPGVNLKDKPDGEVIEEYRHRHYDQLYYDRMEGEWMRVQAVDKTNIQNPRFFGWVRWRDGREILIGSFLSGHRIPEPRSP
jgi:hypothetical protein